MRGMGRLVRVWTNSVGNAPTSVSARFVRENVACPRIKLRRALLRNGSVFCIFGPTGCRDRGWCRHFFKGDRSCQRARRGRRRGRQMRLRSRRPALRKFWQRYLRRVSSSVRLCVRLSRVSIVVGGRCRQGSGCGRRLARPRRQAGHGSRKRQRVQGVRRRRNVADRCRTRRIAQSTRLRAPKPRRDQIRRRRVRTGRGRRDQFDVAIVSSARLARSICPHRRRPRHSSIFVA